MTFLHLNHLSQVVVFAVVDVCDFICDYFLAWFLHTVHLKNVLGSLFCLPICKQHFIIDSPVLVVLLQKQLRLNLRIAPGEVFPPVL
jgi:hypothetical protein